LILSSFYENKKFAAKGRFMTQALYRQTLEKTSALHQLAFKSRIYSIRHILPILLRYLPISLRVVPYVPAKRTELILILFWKPLVMASEKLHT